MQAIQASPSRVARRPTSSEVLATIRPLKMLAARLRRRCGRFEIYDFLESIYRVYIAWNVGKIAKRCPRTLPDEKNIVRRNGMSPSRILIEAILPDTNLKQK